MPTIAPQLAEVAQLVADPGRANILSTLMDGRALSAGDLAGVAGVTAQTTSSHLAKLVARELLVVQRRGPRRFYRLGACPFSHFGGPRREYNSPKYAIGSRHFHRSR